MIEIIGGLWAAGETKTFHINGEYLEILDAQYPCDVMLMDRQGAQLSVMRSSEASFFSRPKEGFNTVQITSQQAQSIRVFVGSGDAGTRRISSTVQVVDGGRSRTVAGAAFMFSAATSGLAGKFAALQLFNPAASGKRLVVKSTRYSQGASGQYGLVWQSATLATVAAGSLVPKLLSGPASAAVGCYDNNLATAAFASPFLSLVSANLAVNAVDTQTFAEPLVVMPGQGLIWFTTVANTSITASAEYVEESLS